MVLVDVSPKLNADLAKSCSDTDEVLCCVVALFGVR